MSDITILLDEITIDDLDIDRVYGVSYPWLKALGFLPFGSLFSM